MELYLPKDQFDNYRPPRLFLCTTGGKRIQELNYYDGQLNAKWNSYSELSFSIDRTYVDILAGEAKVHPAFDKAESLRQVLVEGIGYFILQDNDDVYGDKDSKSLSAFSLEYALSTKYIEHFLVNKGGEDSTEVIYLSTIYGNGYTVDTNNLYKLASGDYNAYQDYYMCSVEDVDKYEQVQVQESEYNDYLVKNNSSIAQPYEKLYVKSYPNVRFYNPAIPELSLIHLVMSYAPDWSIGNVDTNLWRKERAFEIDRTDVYSFLTNDIVDTFKCVVAFDTLNKKVNFYEEADDGLTDDGQVLTRWDTDIYISRDNLASEVNIKVSGDNIKTKLKVSGGDGIDVTEVNLGKSYIMNLDYYHNEDWMEQDLIEAYDDYLEAQEEHAELYEEAVQGWLTAYDEYDKMYNNIAIETNVLLAEDVFKKLYCLYEPYDTAYIDEVIDSTHTIINNLYSEATFTDEYLINKSDLKDKEVFCVQGYCFIYNKENNNFMYNGSMLPYNTMALLKKLYLYRVDEDIDGKVSDNILLTLKDSNSNTATIRIYDPHQRAYTYTYGNYYYVKENDNLYNAVIIDDEKDFNTYSELWTNDYKIRLTTTNAIDSGVSSIATYALSDWIGGTLTDEVLGLKDYIVTSIGIMGAYLVLAKDETKSTVLEDYCIHQLQVKYDECLKTFLTQTEAMLSNTNNSCIASNEQPTSSGHSVGTRWLDTNSRPAILKEYDGTNWNSIEASDDKNKNYKDYARYIDNYEKMTAIQDMLLNKKKRAEYWSNGYSVEYPRHILDVSEGYSVNEHMYNVALLHFADYQISGITLADVDFPLGIFTSSYEPGRNFAVYLMGNIPYVAYEDSMGVFLAKQQDISKKTDIESFLNKDQMTRLSPLIREDVYEDSNFFFNSYESKEEEVRILKELMADATKELKTLSQPSFEFSMTMANILALPKFEPIISQFALGNFIRIELLPGIVKRSRLLECSMGLNDFSDFSCTFGNLVTTKSEIDLHAELLRQAVMAGKQVAASKGSWQAAVDKTNELEQTIFNGLQDVALRVSAGSGQAISWDSTGMHFRKYKAGSTTEYEPEEMAIINNALVATNDSWRTSKAAFGKYVIDGVERWGPIAEYVTADTIEGKYIKGGSIQIGDENVEGGSLFKVNEKGEVSIMSNGAEKYASKSAMEVIDDAYRYRVELLYNNSTVFANTNDNCTITCTIYDNRLQKDVTSDFIANGAKFSWIRASSSDDTTWNANHSNRTTNTITITRSDIEKNAQFSCKITIDETKMPADEES